MNKVAKLRDVGILILQSPGEREKILILKSQKMEIAKGNNPRRASFTDLVFKANRKTSIPIPDIVGPEPIMLSTSYHAMMEEMTAPSKSRTRKK